jgi:hypothetical protein
MGSTCPGCELDRWRAESAVVDEKGSKRRVATGAWRGWTIDLKGYLMRASSIHLRPGVTNRNQ